MFDDPVRVVVPSRIAGQLARVCTLEMDAHRWSPANVAAARQVLEAPDAQAIVDSIHRRLARTSVAMPGWAVLALPDRMGDDDLQRTAAGLLSLLGQPFFSIHQHGRLWIGGESSPTRDSASFGGFGAQALHIDAPNVEQVPDYTSLLVLRPDPAGGGTSLLGDLPAALAQLNAVDCAILRRPEFFEGRADDLRGVGSPLLPFPVVADAVDSNRLWIRWAGRLLDDERNACNAGVLRRFAQALHHETRAVVLGRGQLLIVDQQRIAHGRTALGPASPDGVRRCLLQAKISFDPAAPAHAVAARTVTTRTMVAGVGFGDV